MSRRLTLHVGTPKSGTTYLQSIVAGGRGRLAQDGILYPGARHLPREGFNQQPAIYALAGPSIGWVDDDVRRAGQEYFRHLCQELSAHSGRALVSAESLAFFEVESAQKLLAELGYAPSEVTVIITARDLGRILPSIWQQNVKNGSVQSLGPYLDSVASLRDRPEPTPLWTAFGLPGLVDRWKEVVGEAQRVVLVTSPRQGGATNELWNRFATAAEIPSDLIDSPTSRLRAVDNISLTWSQAELIRHLNEVLQADGYSRAEQQRLRARVLDVWMNLPGSGSRRPALPDHLHDIVHEWARDDIARLEASGARVVGSLTDLEPKLPDRPSPSMPAALDQETVRDILALIEHGKAKKISAVRPPQRLPWAVRRPLRRWRAAAARVDLSARLALRRRRGTGGAPASSAEQVERGEISADVTTGRSSSR